MTRISSLESPERREEPVPPHVPAYLSHTPRACPESIDVREKVGRKTGLEPATFRTTI